MAGRMTPADIRRAMAVAVLDDLWHGQPELENRPVTRQADDGSTFTVYEVRGFIDPAKLGTFGSQQLERLMEHRHPGLLAQLNGGGTQALTQADIEAAMHRGTQANEVPSVERMAASVLSLIAASLPYQPSFEDA